MTSSWWHDQDLLTMNHQLVAVMSNIWIIYGRGSVQRVKNLFELQDIKIVFNSDVFFPLIISFIGVLAVWLIFFSFNFQNTYDFIPHDSCWFFCLKISNFFPWYSNFLSDVFLSDIWRFLLQNLWIFSQIFVFLVFVRISSIWNMCFSFWEKKNHYQ